MWRALEWLGEEFAELLGWLGEYAENKGWLGEEYSEHIGWLDEYERN